MLCACCAALGLTLAENVIPLEKFERQIRLMLALLLMTAILRPLTKLDLSALKTDVSAAEAASGALAETAERAREQAVAQSICAELNRALAERDVPCKVSGVSVHIAQDGSIRINEVRITGNLLTGTVYLHEWLGEDVPVTEGGGTDD